MILLLGHSTSSVLLASAMLFSPQFDTVADIPSSYYSDQRSIFGRVERVIDGDTVRVRHCPSRFFCENRLSKGLPKRIYDSTLSIRLYGIDCPELQKRSTDAPSQPFAEQAQQVTSDLVLGKVVKMTLLRKDQYGRALSIMETPRNRIVPFLGRQDLSEELLRRGLATIYTGGGAEYGGKRDVLEKKLKQAQSRKLGVWSLNEKERMSPADFKRQQKAAAQYAGVSNYR
jgi:endonuclease YncB( thermonuclease family)